MYYVKYNIYFSTRHFSSNLFHSRRPGIITQKMFIFVWFQASAATKIRTTVFCAVTQHVVVRPYRRFGTTYRSRNVGKKLPLYAG